MDFYAFNAGGWPCWFAAVGQVKVGCESSRWVIELRGRRQTLNKPEVMVPLLPWLEFGRQNWHEHLKTFTTESATSGVFLPEFPEKLLLQCAFELSVSDYWPVKGLGWLESRLDLVVPLADALLVLEKRSWAGQSLKRAIKNIRRAAVLLPQLSKSI